MEDNQNIAARRRNLSSMTAKTRKNAEALHAKYSRLQRIAAALEATLDSTSLIIYKPAVSPLSQNPKTEIHIYDLLGAEAHDKLMDFVADLLYTELSAGMSNFTVPA